MEENYLELIGDDEPTIKSKMQIPPYRKNGAEKYDVNWQLGGVKHIWNMSLWKLKRLFSDSEEKTSCSSASCIK